MKAFEEAGVLHPAEVAFARMLGRRGGVTDPHVLLGAALACRAPRAGHVCVHLGAVRDTVGVGVLVAECEARDAGARLVAGQFHTEKFLERKARGCCLNTVFVAHVRRTYWSLCWAVDTGV